MPRSDDRLVVREKDSPLVQTTWLGRRARSERGLETGDVVEISGRSEAVARVEHELGEESPMDAYLSSDVRNNAGVIAGDFVSVRGLGQGIPAAEAITFHPESPETDPDTIETGEETLRDALEGTLLAFGNSIATGLSSPSVVRVGRKTPVGPVRVGPDTAVWLRPEPDPDAMKVILEDMRTSFERSLDRREKIVTSLVHVVQLNFLIASIVIAGFVSLSGDGFAFSDYASNAFLLSGSLVWVISTGYAIYLNRDVGGSRIIGLSSRDLWRTLFRGGDESDATFFLLESYDDWVRRNVTRNGTLVGNVWWCRIGTFLSIVLLAIGILIEIR